MLSDREADVSKEGFYYWPFVSLHSWGETATGEDQTGIWKITLWDSVNIMATEGTLTYIVHPNAKAVIIN